MGIFSWLVVGFVAGWWAGQVMQNRGYGLVGDAIHMETPPRRK
jgi:uncharacterized membrane protein YeaQ/YmgE (transglycosylase-associated protein family)